MFFNNNNKKLDNIFLNASCPNLFHFTRYPGAKWATTVQDGPFPSELSSVLLCCLKKGRGGGRKRWFLSCQIWHLSATLMGQNDEISLHSVSYNLIVINYERNYNSSTWVQIFLFAGRCFACFIKFSVFHTIQCSTKNSYHSVPTQRVFHAVQSTNIIFIWGWNIMVVFQYVKYVHLKVELRIYFKYSSC